MTDKKSSSLTVLWRLTAGVAAILLIITLMMLVKSQTGSSASFTGTINDQSMTAYLRSRPDVTARTIAILNPGTEVEVDRSATRADITWYHISTESGSGWIPEENLILSNP